jgi:pyruvate formate lyase activating enzyme
MREAELYRPIQGGAVECLLCRHHCIIKDGRSGICGVRENRGGKLYSIFYGRPVAVAVDPIEKKPLFHFLPGSRSFSIATPGCNFQCSFCQNWDISQYKGGEVPTYELSPREAAEKARKLGCASISYTYSEPTVFFEYARDTAIEAERFGLKNVFVTNGYMTREMIDAFHPHLHAANIDLKSFNKDVYRRIMKGDRDGVLDSIRYMKEKGIWIEITTLIVPQMNDSEEEIREIARFIAGVGRDIPWHISRFHPAYKMTEKPPTPLETLIGAYRVGKEEGLKFIYIGNVGTDSYEATYCPKCRSRLISRSGFDVLYNRLLGNRCPECGEEIEGLF